MARIEIRVKPDYIRSEAITYFFLALLTMQAAAMNYDPTKPFFSWYQLGFIPLPFFNLTYWLPLLMGFVCLSFSIIFLVALSHPTWVNWAVRFADNISVVFVFLLPISFITSWAIGLAAIGGLDVTVVSIFGYVGFVMFLYLEAHFIVSLIRRGR